MTYRFGQAAKAIGVTEAGLRNWMTRNSFDLWGERPEGGWRTFTQQDVMILALAAELVSYGAKVDEAVSAVQNAVAEVADADPFKLPSYLHAARSTFGGWELHEDEGMALSLAGNRSALKIAPSVIMSAANKILLSE